MLFSRHFGVRPSKTQPDWFDPVLDFDTELFIDPFLIFKTGNETQEFVGAHDEIIAFFDQAFRLGARSMGKPGNSYFKLVAMLHFPEPKEFCIGYASTGTDGSGSGHGFSYKIAKAVIESIKAGITSLAHFEELALLEKGIGVDRISDITANILKARFIRYTQRICASLGVPTVRQRIANASFDTRLLQWEDATADLPKNPFNGLPVLLTPARFLRRLPSINRIGFEDYLWTYHNEHLRANLNYDIKRRLKKTEIIRLAKQHREWVRDYVIEVENRQPQPYDFVRDSDGVYAWEAATHKFATDNVLQVPPTTDLEGLDKVVGAILHQFKLFVEDNSGYKLLWNDDSQKPKREEASQLLLLGIVKHYCRANNIDVSRETNIGKGPVDFKFSTGYAARVLVEMKRASNTQFWDGLYSQLPAYMQAEEISLGYFLVIVAEPKDVEKVKDVGELAARLSEHTGLTIRTLVVDATKGKPSASHIRKRKGTRRR